MEEGFNTNEKVIFAISFLTVLVALSDYKDFLDQIKVSIFSHSFSIFDLLTCISVIMFCSVYFSALDNLRWRSIKLAQSKLLEKCNPIADFLYLVAIVVLPMTFIAGYFVSFFFYGIIHVLSFFFQDIPYSDLAPLFTSIISLVTVIYAIVVSYQLKSINNCNKEIRDKILETRGRNKGM
ncbi:hypothetical protein [Methanosarcina mazei]|uniref:hypothetical protein n=1 Tax=Methanosarcina mazei TaxID=2209 RepID=UPI00064EDFA1|nr:hypothetical protein [Methanosarcina mazei]